MVDRKLSTLLPTLSISNFIDRWQLLDVTTQRPILFCSRFKWEKLTRFEKSLCSQRLWIKFQKALWKKVKPNDAWQHNNPLNCNISLISYTVNRQMVYFTSAGGVSLLKHPFFLLEDACLFIKTVYHGTEEIDWRGKIIYPAVCVVSLVWKDINTRIRKDRQYLTLKKNYVICNN